MGLACVILLNPGEDANCLQYLHATDRRLALVLAG